MQGLVGTATQVAWITDSTNFFKTFLKKENQKTQYSDNCAGDQNVGGRTGYQDHSI
jgi:hypothetical protein